MLVHVYTFVQVDDGFRSIAETEKMGSE